MNLVSNKLRVVHIPQLGTNKIFKAEVSNEREAFLVSEVLANQHLFLYEQNFIHDYSNVIFVEMWDENMEADGDGNKWCNYHNEGEDMDWDQFKEVYSDYINGY